MGEVNYAFTSNYTDCELVSDKFLQINNIGFITTKFSAEAISLTKRPPRKDHMLVYYIKKGGYLEIDGVVHEMNGGDLYYLAPGTPLIMSHKSESQHYWIHFTGASVQEIMASAGMLKTGIYHIGHDIKLAKILSEISFMLVSATAASVLHCNGLFLQALSLISTKIVKNNNDLRLTETILQPALIEMHTRYFEQHSLEYYAKLCNMSASSFNHTFKNKTKVTPVTYLTTIRMERAKLLLASTKMTIEQISLSTGYTTPQYFSKIFKKYTGMTPNEYKVNSKRDK